MSAGTVVGALELAGLYVFATSGALMAIHKRFDVVGIVVLAMLTALDAMRRWFVAPWTRRALQAATGIALVALAIRVIV